MERVTVVEVGPRDGLQNEHVAVSTAEFYNLATNSWVTVTSMPTPRQELAAAH